MDLDHGIIPLTVKEGKTYCKYFNQAMLERRLKFNTQKKIQNQFLFANLPRSGSNLIKALMEEITGYYISDPSGHSPHGDYLCERGVCFGTIDHCQIIKTHYPMYDYKSRIPEPLSAKKAIILIRDPIGVCESYFHLCATSSHDDRLPKKYYENSPTYMRFLEKTANEYKEYLDYWINEKRILKLFIRFEDYCSKPKETLETIFKFFEGTETLPSQFQDNINKLELQKEFFKSPYKMAKKYEQKVDIYQELPKSYLIYTYNLCKSELAKMKYVSYMKNRAPFLNGDDVKDEACWLDNHNKLAMQYAFNNSNSSLPELIIPKPEFSLKIMTVGDTTFLNPNWFFLGLAYSIKNKNLYFLQLVFYYMLRINLTATCLIMMVFLLSFYYSSQDIVDCAIYFTLF